MTHSFESKHAKYATQNPISRYLVHNFYTQIADIVNTLQFDSVLDVGCGEGVLLHSLQHKMQAKTCYAIDLDPNEVADATKNLPFCQVQVGSAYDIPFDDGAVELVICTEVLEHLDDPLQALQELSRVTRRFALISVPREPIWRILNMARGAYWSAWGNTPDHVNHWSSRGFRRFASLYFTILEQRRPLPWTILLGEKK